MVGEEPAEFPFTPHRYFVIQNVPNRSIRGKHAHKQLEELLICLRGSLTVTVDDGVSRTDVVLTRSTGALYLPPLVWREHFGYSRGTILLVLASAEYDATDYIRDYQEFLERVR